MVPWLRVRRGSAVDVWKAGMCGRSPSSRRALNPAATQTSVALCRAGVTPGPAGGFCQSMEAGMEQQSETKVAGRRSSAAQPGPFGLSSERSGCPCEPALAPLTGRARIVAFGQSTPPAYDQIQLWRDYYADHVGHDGVAERVWRRSEVRTRHLTASPRARGRMSLEYRPADATIPRRRAAPGQGGGR